MFSGTVPKQKTLERNMASIPSTTPYYVFANSVKNNLPTSSGFDEKALRLHLV